MKFLVIIILEVLLVVHSVSGNLSQPSVVSSVSLNYSLNYFRPSSLLPNVAYGWSQQDDQIYVTEFTLGTSNQIINFTTPFFVNYSYLAHFNYVVGFEYLEIQPAGYFLVSIANDTSTLLLVSDLHTIVDSLFVDAPINVYEIQGGPYAGNFSGNFVPGYIWYTTTNVPIINWNPDSLQLSLITNIVLNNNSITGGSISTVIISGDFIYFTNPELCFRNLSLSNYTCVDNHPNMKRDYMQTVSTVITKSQKRLLCFVGYGDQKTLVVYDIPSMQQLVVIDATSYTATSFFQHQFSENGEIGLLPLQALNGFVDLSMSGIAFIFSFLSPALFYGSSSWYVCPDLSFVYIAYTQQSTSIVTILDTHPMLSPFSYAHIAQSGEIMQNIFATGVVQTVPSENGILYSQGLLQFLDLSQFDSPTLYNINVFNMSLYDTNQPFLTPEGYMTIIQEEINFYDVQIGKVDFTNKGSEMFYTVAISNEYFSPDPIDADSIIDDQLQVNYISFACLQQLEEQAIIAVYATVIDKNYQQIQAPSLNYTINFTCPESKYNFCYFRYFSEIFRLGYTATTYDFVFCVAAILQQNFRIVHFSYDLSSNTLMEVSSQTVEDNCNFIRSIAKNNELWIMCADIDDSHIFFLKFSFLSQQPVLRFDLFSILLFPLSNVPPSFWVDDTGNRIGIADQTNKIVNVYEISQGKISLVYSTDILAIDAQLYSVPETKTQILVVADMNGDIIMVSDCGPGYQPSNLSYCIPCPVGSFGVGCRACTPGYVCDTIGLSSPVKLCPSGYFCEQGTDNFNYNSSTSPQLCPPGLYCPSGASTGVFNSSQMMTPMQCIGNYYCPAGTAFPSLQCPASTTSGIGSSSIADCICVDGFVGLNGECVKCPDKCKCQSTTSGTILSGCWLPEIETSHPPMQCPIFSLEGGNQCNPMKQVWVPGTPYPCQQGYHGRMCSECDVGYYSNGRQCFSCSNFLKSILPIIYFGTLVVSVIYVWHSSPADSAAVTIALFHYQVLVYLLMGGIQWENLVFESSGHRTSSLSYVAVECLISSWDNLYSLLFVVLLPVSFTVVILLTIPVVSLFKFIQRRDNRTYSQIVRKKIKTRMIRSVANFTGLIYMYIVTMVANMFGCHKSQDGNFLNSYPYVECKINGIWGIYLLIAIFALIIEVLGFPSAVFFILRKNREQLQNKKLSRAIGSLYCAFKSESYQWTVVAIGRRFIIALLTSVIAYGNPTLAAALFVIILGYFWLLLAHNPYIRNSDHFLDSISQVVLLITLFGGVLISEYPGLSIFILICNMGFLIACAVIIIPYYYRKFKLLFWKWKAKLCGVRSTSEPTEITSLIND